MLETGRRGSSTISRRRAVSVASSRSSTVRCACRARHCCLRAAELCAAARAAGPFSMSFESARIILGALLA